jgi:hypothetical protein
MSGWLWFRLRKSAAVAALGLGLVPSACTRFADMGFDAQSALGSVSLSDRCGDFLHRAFPNSGVEVTGSKVNAELNATSVAVTAIRGDVPKDGLYAREIAAECRFENGILTGFRWTKGPLRP